MDDSKANSEHRESFLPWTLSPPTGQIYIDQAKFAQPPLTPQTGESAVANTKRKRKGRKPTLTADERKTKKNASDRNYRRDRKDKFDRLMKIASECGGIDQLESDVFQRFKQIKSKYGGCEEIESKLKKLEQMEAESAVLEKVKTMVGGIENVMPELERLQKTEFKHVAFKQNQLEPVIDLLPPSSYSLQGQSNHAEHSMNSNNQGSSSYSDMIVTTASSS